ncbi:MAG: hypothetical protein AAGA29_00475 [Planctomycetota bacterium]
MHPPRHAPTLTLCAALLAIFALLACSSSAPADVRTPSPSADSRLIFVSPNGDNTNPGTSPDQAVATIQVGLDRLRANSADWLLLQRGHTYHAEALANLPNGRAPERAIIIGAYGHGTTPNLVTRANLGEFSQNNRQSHNVHVYHVNLIREDEVTPPPTHLWTGVAATEVETLDVTDSDGLEAVLKNPVGMTNISIIASGEIYKGAFPALIVGLRTRVSGLGSDDGVTFRGWGIKVRDANEGAIEHLRIRLGDDNVQDAVDNQGQVLREGRGDRSQPGNGADCVQVFNSPDARLSHVSMFWALDESLDIANSPGVQVYRCLLAECLSEAYHTGSQGDRIYEHSKAILVAGWDVPNGYIASNYEPVVVRECLLAHNNDRNPAWVDALPGLTSGGPTLLNFAFVNNVIYNPVRFLGHPDAFLGPDPNVRVDFIGNVFILGPDSPDDFRPQYWVNLVNTVNSENGSVYVDNNWVIDKDGVAHDLLDWMDARDLDWAQQPHFVYETPLETNRDELIDTVLTYAGDYTHRDEHDWRVINDVRNGTGNIIDSQSEVID